MTVILNLLPILFLAQKSVSNLTNAKSRTLHISSAADYAYKTLLQKRHNVST